MARRHGSHGRQLSCCRSHPDSAPRSRTSRRRSTSGTAGAPEGPYIDSQRDNKAFGFGDGKIFLSEDNAKTWAHSAAFPEAENITFSVILKNGNILFATREQLFLSTDNLKTHREIIVKNRDGSDYLPHTPMNPESARLVFPFARRRAHLGRGWQGDARVGQLLQRHRRPGAGEHLLLHRQRARR